MNYIKNLTSGLRKFKYRKDEKNLWINRGFASPSPSWIKHAVLLRRSNANSIWVETGTYLGDTTALLAKVSKLVYTIEPDHHLYEMAHRRFLKDSNIHVINGLSEGVFPDLLPKLNGNVNFWLDGHYSGETTHKGPRDCPIREELSFIEKNVHRFDKVVVLIDDVRCFNPKMLGYEDYPELNFLVDWARKNNLSWSIEHDIFIAESNY